MMIAKSEVDTKEGYYRITLLPGEEHMWYRKLLEHLDKYFSKGLTTNPREFWGHKS